jgi:glycosidase
VGLFISKNVRGRLGNLAGDGGKLVVSSLRFARELSQALDPDEGAAELNALSLLEEAVQRVVDKAADEELVLRTVEEVERELGREGLSRLLETFEREFGLEIVDESGAEGTHDGTSSGVEAEAENDADSGVASAEKQQPLSTTRRSAGPASDGGSSAGRERSSPPAQLVRELLVFWWLHSNPALEKLNGLLDTSGLAESREFRAADKGLRRALAEAPGVKAGDDNLLASLEAPLLEQPESPVEQLRFVLPGWHEVLTAIEPEIVAGLDLAAEEHAPRFPPGPGPVEAPGLPGPEVEGAGWPAPTLDARYTEDRDWMPRLTLVAKNALVWLQQLSSEYERQIHRLDEIPGEALAELAERGFTGLWLIGVWERSEASQRIKRMCGNPEAEASAYSLRGYRIAERLGGAEALADLRWRAGEHGLRLAADMVPNHTGIDSDWVIDHPERFVGQADCPFPGYRFEGADLSPDSEIAIHIEDHYYDRSDAAVVFQRTDKRSGERRYLYHGNDGTSMPWNDTAQLDYLNEETREAVMEQILEVARSFSVIRFDAAMTLTRQHVQRLWFPRPGDAGAIPSRAEHSLSTEEFDQRMPEEFWREVVDRVAEELPDTLLIAEAFWLLEGYFVRTLGMHRVYNSAFMHMLRDGDTAGYRKLLRETLEFDPAILERYVNFMSNPDEETAAEQFGRGDRYRGVCLLLATLPGLPMFAHGQVEGFHERYGMEYGRSYKDETADEELVRWHQERVAPLLGRRELFAGTELFQLFDFVAESGKVDEAVLTYSNGVGDERLLALYNHSDRRVRGRVHLSVPRVERAVEAGDGLPLSAALTEALALDPTRPEHLLRDRLSAAESPVDYSELVEQGLTWELGPYEFFLLSPVRESGS